MSSSSSSSPLLQINFQANVTATDDCDCCVIAFDQLFENVKCKGKIRINLTKFKRLEGIDALVNASKRLLHRFHRKYRCYLTGRSTCIEAMRRQKVQFSFRCDTKGFCKRKCQRLPLNEEWCLMRNSTHDIKCCVKDHCNWKDTPLFATTKKQFSLLPGVALMARLLTPIIQVFFIIYPIAASLIHNWLAAKQRRTHYNPPVDPKLLEKAELLFGDSTPPKPGEPLDGCLNIDEFKHVLQALSDYSVAAKPQIQPQTRLVTYTSYMIHESLGFDQAVIVRSEPTKFESLLIRMIEQGPGFFDVEAVEFYELLSELSEILRAEGSLLELSADIVVIGELRGRYSDLLRWFQLYGYPPKRRYLFLGGLIDEECAESVETFAFLAAFKVTTPGHIYMIRGTTEFFPFQIQKRFSAKLCMVLSAFVTRVCSEMPIAATIGSDIFAVHSGISSKLNDLEQIRKIKGSSLKSHCNIVQDLIFGMPSSTVETFKKNKEGKGYFFGAKAIEQFLQRLQMKLIIRTHTAYEKGHFMFASKQLLTIWSTSGCCNVKLASTLDVDKDFRVTIHSITPVISPDELKRANTEVEIVEVVE